MAGELVDLMAGHTTSQFAKQVASHNFPERQACEIGSYIRHRAGGTRSVPGLMSLGILPGVSYLLINGPPPSQHPFSPSHHPFSDRFWRENWTSFLDALFGSLGDPWRVKRRLWLPK